VLKMTEPTKQQMREPNDLLKQRQSLEHKILMFPLTRLLIAGIVLSIARTCLVANLVNKVVNRGNPPLGLGASPLPLCVRAAPDIFVVLLQSYHKQS
jgi:hypothetical protein